MLDINLNVKIGDFGFAKLDNGNIRGTFGSEFHRAPEIINGPHPFIGEKADVFALAVILFAIQMKKFPVEHYYNVTDAPLY